MAHLVDYRDSTSTFKGKLEKPSCLFEASHQPEIIPPADDKKYTPAVETLNFLKIVGPIQTLEGFLISEFLNIELIYLLVRHSKLRTPDFRLW